MKATVDDRDLGPVLRLDETNLDDALAQLTVAIKSMQA